MCDKRVVRARFEMRGRSGETRPGANENNRCPAWGKGRFRKVFIILLLAARYDDPVIRRDKRRRRRRRMWEKLLQDRGRGGGRGKIISHRDIMMSKSV